VGDSTISFQVRASTRQFRTLLSFLGCSAQACVIDCMQVKDMYSQCMRPNNTEDCVPNYPALLRFVPALRNVGPSGFKSAPRVLSPAQNAEGYTLRRVF